MKALLDCAKDALELTTVQRLTLARILLDLAEGNFEVGPEGEAAWEDEVARRMAEVKTGAARSSGVDDVFARLDQRAV